MPILDKIVEDMDRLDYFLLRENSHPVRRCTCIFSS